MPTSAVLNVQRVENLSIYEQYSVLRQITAFSSPELDANERYMWYGADLGSNFSEIVEKGFSSGSLPARRDHMRFGLGFLFAPDARLADYLSTLGVAGMTGERRLLLCRVACGRVAERIPISSQTATEELRDPISRMPPNGFQVQSALTSTCPHPCRKSWLLGLQTRKKFV